MPAYVEIVARYVPALVARRFGGDRAPLSEPILDRFPAAVVFADISGFTSLAERLAQQGSAGVEELTKHLNAYFGRLIALIAEHGGDVVKFAGDALLAIWSVTEGEINSSLEEATRRAAGCSLAIAAELGDYVAEDVRLTLHAGIGAGEIAGVHVGGVNKRWEFLLAGAPLAQMAGAEASAKPGEVCISAEGWALIKDQFAGTVLESGEVRLERAIAPLPPRREGAPALVPEMAAALRGYIPRNILAHLDAGQTQWLAELRRVTVLFAKLPALDCAAAGFLDRLQDAMQAMQKAVYQYEGVIRQLIVDDKGCVLIAAFGLPSVSHEDDAGRGLLAAIDMHAELHKLGLASGIGVTTGWVYCGTVGSEMRCEYAMVGDTVNLAARLMVAASDGVLSDDRTREAARGRLMFESLPSIRVKGKQEPVTIYRPSAGAQVACRTRLSVVGRAAERHLLAEKLERLCQEGAGGVVAVEGEAGIGKSRLLEYLRERALEKGATVLEGAGDAVEKSTPYRAWRDAFGQLFALDALGDAADKKAVQGRVEAQLRSRPDWLRKAPLLNAVLPLNFPENEFTRQLRGQALADNTRDLLLDLLQAKAKASPVVLILEDAHWMDSASWALARLVAERIQGLLLVVATRPQPEASQYRQILRSPGAVHLRLEALSLSDTVAIACERLGVASVPEPVADLICDKAQGNPFFCEELVYALRDSGAIAIADGECRLSMAAETFQAFSIPDTVQGIITSRIDRLMPMQQLALKVASVIGRVFAFRILHDTYPIEEDKSCLKEYVQTLEKLDLTLLETPEPNLAYLFKHVITRDVAYNLMLFSQRRQLHEAVANWYERTQAGDLSPFYSILAYHWSNAAEPARGESVQVAKAIDYLEKAGEQALRSHSLQETVRFFSEALTLARQSCSPISKSREACWERQLGEAYLGLGQLLHSREHLARSLALSGRPVSAAGPKLLVSLLQQLLQQAVHRAGYVRDRAKSAAEREALLESARIYDSLAEIYYHANEIVAAIYCAQRALNLAERAGPSPELARAYANSCFAAGVIPLHALAEAYNRRAREIAASVDSGGATEARVLIITSAYSTNVGQWEKIQTSLDKAKKICYDLGDWHQWGNCIAILAKVAYFRGEFALGARLWAEGSEVARRQGDILQQAWGLNGQAEGLLRQGEVDKAASLLEESLGLFAQNRDRVSETATWGMLAIARLYRGEEELAFSTALNAQQRLEQISSPNSYYLIEGYASTAEVYLTLWETNRTQPDADIAAIAQLARKACKALHRFARVFPIGEPRAWLWRGWCDWLAGDRDRARSSWRKSLTAGERLAMPYEQARAHWEIGRHATGSESQYHLTRAREIFAELGAAGCTERDRVAVEAANSQAGVPIEVISL